MVRPWIARLDSPLGYLRARGADSLQELEFDDAMTEGNEEPLAARLQVELNEYFRGERTTFSIPVAPKGTDFQRQVWALLMAIPHGQTRTYGDLARELGDKNKVRAVGLANGANPIAILIPCHRVIGSDGELTGYAGGIERKHRLLEIESRQQTLF